MTGIDGSNSDDTPSKQKSVNSTSLVFGTKHDSNVELTTDS